jgi:LacI family transcriptional regulator
MFELSRRVGSEVFDDMSRGHQKRGVVNPAPARRPKVALLIETSNAYARGILKGVVDYIRHHEAWSVYFLELGRGDLPPAWISRWDGDGIIARIENKKIAAVIRALGLPTVDVSSGRHIPSVPWVETDDSAIADLAAQHFLDRGFRHFGYCGKRGYNWSRWRQNHFGRRIRAAGYECQCFAPTQQRIDDQIAAIESWLQTLPKPIGILASYDIRAQHVLDACRNVGLSVPDEVAVLGVDDDELICELVSPRLSSIILDSGRTGYLAADTLAGMMRGEQVGPLELRVPPIGVHLRQSTDVLATDDTQIVRAIQFIREHADKPLQVQHVASAAGSSRKGLEARFKSRLNHSVHAEIIRVRIERIKFLLAHTNFKLADIADRFGFEHPEYMNVLFKRETGVTPGAYRASVRKQRPK